MEVAFKSSFLRELRKLPKALREEAIEKVELFKDPENHGRLRIHKLSGALAGRMSFSVNYRYRIIFMWEKKNVSAILLAIGDHALYD
ncbi:MAG: type II toxin-antitoxin system mRNA interferase toxin, RelE/StbE family [Minisyncoccia bacterium]